MGGILGLTTTEQIRAVLTVSTSDLPDSVLESYGLEDDLRAELASWVPTWNSVEDAEQETLLRLFAKYHCATLVASTASIFVLTKRSDGNNEGQRSGSDLGAVADAMRRSADKYKARLNSLLSESSTTTGIVFASRVTPSRDVITEGRDVSG